MFRSFFRIVEFSSLVKARGTGPIKFPMEVYKENLWNAGAKPLPGAAAVMDN